ncbi:hypothetical protein AB1Y20_006675 [Prymnesium parvum]|uniref:Calmodulin n=1 Tax=Prymnesium parvum TaxID=97485 RepID=A0AB34IZ25_PRYPA
MAAAACDDDFDDEFGPDFEDDDAYQSEVEKDKPHVEADSLPPARSSARLDEGLKERKAAYLKEAEALARSEEERDAELGAVERSVDPEIAAKAEAAAEAALRAAEAKALKTKRVQLASPEAEPLEPMSKAAEATKRAELLDEGAPVMVYDVASEDAVRLRAPPAESFPAPPVPPPPPPQIPQPPSHPPAQRKRRPRRATTAVATVVTQPSARRTLSDMGEWQRLTLERLNSPARRSRVGLRAKPLGLAGAIERRSLTPRAKSSHKVTTSDLAQMTLLYGASEKSLRLAPLKSLDLHSFTARLPGVDRPLTRELAPARLAAVSLERGSHGEPLCEGGGVLSAPPSLPPHKATAQKLPPGWVGLCGAREAIVEQLHNLALRLHAFGRHWPASHLANVRKVVAQGLGELRRASLVLVEEVMRWQEAQALRQESDPRRGKASGRHKPKQELPAEGLLLQPSKRKSMRGATITPKEAAKQSAGYQRLRPDLHPSKRLGPGIFSSYALKFVTMSPSALVRPREAAVLWDGFNYLLKMMSDVCRLPLPTSSDPFFLRWFDDASTSTPGERSVFAAEMTNSPDEVVRMKHAELALKRMLRPPHCVAMNALEVSTGLRMLHLRSEVVQPASPGSTRAGSPDRRNEEEAQAQIWMVLASVLYEEGPTEFGKLKRTQWKQERAACLVQMSFRRQSMKRRVRQRLHVKREAAARLVQYYYRNKLRVGVAGTRLLELSKLEHHRIAEAKALERQAKLTVERTREEAERIRAARARQMAALTASVREYASLHFIQRAVRGAMARWMKRKLLIKHQTYLRSFSSMANGYNVKMVTIFQKRIRLRLAHNEFFLELYEDHRTHLQAMRSQGQFDEFEETLKHHLEEDAKLIKSLEEELADQALVAQHEANARLKVCRARGEIAGLRASQNISTWPTGPSSEVVPMARRMMQVATAEIAELSKQVDALVHQRSAARHMAARCEAAAGKCEELEAEHPIALPLMLGQELMLHRSADVHLQAHDDACDALDDAFQALEARSAELVQAEAYSRPDQKAAREQKLERLVGSLPRLLEELAISEERADELKELTAELARHKGTQYLMAMLLQRCQWRRWQDARMERVIAITVLRDTRNAACRAKELINIGCEAKGIEKVIRSLVVHTSTPACTVTLRPARFGNLPSEITVDFFNELARECFLEDIADGLHADVDLFEIVSQGYENAEQDDDSVETAQLSTELLVASGACDITVRVVHGGGSDERMFPEALLAELVRLMPYGELPMTKMSRGLQLPAGAVMEYRVISSEVPPLPRVNVRRVLPELQAELGEAKRQIEMSLIEAKAKKREIQQSLEPGVRAPRNKALKEEEKMAQAAYRTCSEILRELPDRRPDDDLMLQFEWLPGVLQEHRARADKLLAEHAELKKLEEAMLAREDGKQMQLRSAAMMHALSQVRLPDVEPEVENAGKLMLRPLHNAFYNNRQLLYARKQLACNISHFASMLAAEMALGSSEIASLNTDKLTRRQQQREEKTKMTLFERRATLIAMNHEQSRSRLRAEQDAVAEKKGARMIDVLSAGSSLMRVKAMMLFTPNPELSDPQRSITPARVLDMCEELGIRIHGAEPEFFLLWLAVEALSAPLPPLWRRVLREDATAEDAEEQKLRAFRFEHAVTRVDSNRHPLLPVFVESVEKERARKNKPRSWSALEHWFLFAGEHDAIYFYDFQTGQRSRETPQEVMELHAAVQQRRAEEFEDPASPSARKSTAGGHQRNVSNAELREIRKQYALGARKSIKPKVASTPVDVDAVQSPQLVARRDAKRRIAELKTRSVPFRQESLRLRPRSLPELLSAGQKLGVNLVSSPNLLWLIDVILATDQIAAPVQQLTRNAWKAFETKYNTKVNTSTMAAGDRLRLMTHGECPYYFTPISNIGDEQHPMIACAKDVNALNSLAMGIDPGKPMTRPASRSNKIFNDTESSRRRGHPPEPSSSSFRSDSTQQRSSRVTISLAGDGR